MSLADEDDAIQRERQKRRCGASVVILNEGSTARDFLAKERNFLSWVKLSITLWTISSALVLRFHFEPRQTTPAFELAAGLPVSRLGDAASKKLQFLKSSLCSQLAALFFIAAVASLVTGTVGYYSDSSALRERVGFISIGRWTNLVVGGICALTITCCVLLLIGRTQPGSEAGLS